MLFIFFLQLILLPLIFAGNIIKSEANTKIKVQPKDLGVGPHSFDYLLGENSDFDTPADIIFVDYDVKESVITDLLNSGKRVICYANVGAWEDWRSDAEEFPSSVLGNDYEGWPGEKWLDVRKIDILLPIMRERFEMAAEKGCEGIDPDNMNGYSVDTGFPITAAQQIAYNEAIAEEIRSTGMLAGLKNDNDQAWDLVDSCDFAVVEQCAAYEECEAFDSFIQSDKPVFAIEYTESWDEDDFWDTVCSLGEETSISFILKDMDLHNDFTASCLTKKTKGSKKPKAKKSKIPKSRVSKGKHYK